MNIKKIKIFNNGSWVEYALDGTTIDNAANLEVGSKPGATQTKDAIWNGGTQKDEENIIRVKDGDTVDGAIADGFQSVAFGGKRYDKVRKNDNPDTSRKPTTVKGVQSFAAGGSVTVEGDYSAGFGKDSKAYQRCSFVAGAAEAGLTEDEFNEKYAVVVGSATVPKFITIFTDTLSNNTYTETASVVYQYTAYTKNYNSYMTSNNISRENIELEGSATREERFIYKKKTVIGADNLVVPEFFAALRENVSLKDVNYTGKHKCADYEGKWYDISYSFATAFDGGKAKGRASFAAANGKAIGDCSVAFGGITLEDNSFAAGENVVAKGMGSVAFGRGDKTENYGALGAYSAHFGDKNKVEGVAQFASGRGLIASGIEGAAYVGKYNATNLNPYSLFTVGGGSSDSDRKNLLTVFRDGRVRLLDNIAENLNDNDVTRLKDVKEVVNNEKTEREAADTEINNIVNTKADKTYVDELIANTKEELLGTKELKDTYDTILEIAGWIENDETGAAAMANEISKHNDILNGFGEENEPSNIKEYVDGAIENINTNLENTIASLDEEGIKLKSDLYTYASIGKISSASDSNPAKVASAGESLKSVFNAIFGEPKDVQPTITVSGVSLSVDPKTKSYSGGEFGTKLGSDTIDITFTFSNVATNNFGCIIGGIKHPDVKTFKYTVNKQNGKDVKIIMPNDKFSIDTKYAATIEGNNIYCNFVDNEVVVKVTLDEIVSSSSEQVRYPSVKAIVDLGNAINNDGEIISAFLTFQGNEATDTSKLTMADKEVSTNDYTISAGSKYTYYATTTSTNEPTSWKKYGLGTTSVTDLTISANAGEYIWIASASSYASIYAFNEVSGKYNTDKTATTKTSNKTLANSQGANVGGYHFYRTTNPMSLASENKYKLGN